MRNFLDKQGLGGDTHKKPEDHNAVSDLQQVCGPYPVVTPRTNVAMDVGMTLSSGCPIWLFFDFSDRNSQPFKSALRDSSHPPTDSRARIDDSDKLIPDVVDDRNFVQIINEENPSQVHKVIQAYYYDDVTRKSISELYEILSHWNSSTLRLT